MLGDQLSQFAQGLKNSWNGGLSGLHPRNTHKVVGEGRKAAGEAAVGLQAGPTAAGPAWQTRAYHCTRLSMQQPKSFPSIL